MESNVVISGNTLIKATNLEGNYSIPNFVTCIEREAFRGNSELIAIIIPDSVKEIGYGAFRDCYRLKSVRLPTGLKKIDDSTFEACWDLDDIDLPDTIETIGSESFCGCSFKTLKLPKSLNTIGYHAFNGSKLTRIKLPRNLVCIFGGCFHGTPLKNITVDKANKEFFVDEGVLYSTNPKELVYYPQTKKEDSYRVLEGTEGIYFYGFGMSKLQKLYLPSSINSIGAFAFIGCSAILEIHLDVKNPEQIRVPEFEESTVNCMKLYVPKGSGKKYRDHKEFSKFREIIIE